MGLLIENCRIAGLKEGSVYCEGGVISRILGGTSQDVPEGTTRINACGGALFTGFTDTHCHPFELGWLKRSVDLRGTGNIGGLQLKVLAAVQKARPGEWVTGMGWDHETFPEKRLPNRGDIDGVSPVNPVAITRVCGHITLLNGRAIETLCLESRSGAEYDRDATGAMTGIVRERAQEDVFRRIPSKDAQKCLDDLLSAESEAVRYGLTTVHCILSSDAFREELEALAARLADGSPSPRYRVYIPADAMEHVAQTRMREKLRGDQTRINGVKLYADGSLGASTAALREPYSDDPSNSGLLRYGDEELAEVIGRADSAGYQVIIHAIGDRAIEQAIDALTPVVGGGNPHRHRVEHASLLPPDLRSKMKKLGIRAAIQPSFVVSDSWAVRRLGEDRVRDLYPFRSMLKERIPLSGSSDAPVETLSPVIGMWASLVRTGFSPEERLTLRQALELYTSNAATNGFDEEETVLKEGGRADLTLLDSKVDGMHPAVFRKVRTAATIIGGDIAYSFEGNA